VAQLRSLKHYFLLDQGDFFVHFMDIAHQDLNQGAGEVPLSRLQSLLEMCLRSRNVDDPFQVYAYKTPCVAQCKATSWLP